MVAVPSIGRATAVDGAPVPPEVSQTQDLYERYAARIYGYCLHKLGSREEAEDAVQTTFLNAFRALRGGVVPHLEGAWLFKIAENVCLSRHRSHGRRRLLETADDIDALQDVLPAPSRLWDDLHGLDRALAGMPEQQRKAILLREWQGLSYREIAAELSLSQSAVETLIFRARRSLADGLEGRAFERPSARRARRELDVGSVLGVVKSLFLGGGAAVKIAATAAIVATATAVGTPIVRHHRVPAPARTHLARPAAAVQRSVPRVVATPAARTAPHLAAPAPRTHRPAAAPARAPRPAVPVATPLPAAPAPPRSEPTAKTPADPAPPAPPVDPAPTVTPQPPDDQGGHGNAPPPKDGGRPAPHGGNGPPETPPGQAKQDQPKGR